MKPNTLRKRLVMTLNKTRRQILLTGGTTVATEFIQKLPVEPRHANLQKALIKEVRSIDRQIEDTVRRLKKASIDLERLKLKR